MLRWITALGQFRLGELLVLYPAEEQKNLGPYLLASFFRTPGAVLALWEQEGQYVSALRLEPYRDGILIAGLVTARQQRRKGYARALLREVQRKIPPGTKLYSHVGKKNSPSLSLHESCGFQVIRDCALYLNGSLDFKSCTLLYESDPDGTAF